jgi:hypothetical protein
METNMNETITCPNCGWVCKEEDLLEEWYSTISPSHPLSGTEGYRYFCPSCETKIKEVPYKWS